MRKLRWLLLLLVVLAACGYLFRDFILGGLGDYLVQAEAPQKADMIVVLAGDQYGHRIMKGCELVRAGYAPKAMISGPRGIYGFTESELAIRFAAKHGCPEDYFIPIENDANSTQDEAVLMTQEMRRRGVKKYLLVTSNYHTRRAGGFFRHTDPGLEVHVVAAPDEAYTPHGWWHTRIGRKAFAFEAIKTVMEWFGA